MGLYISIKISRPITFFLNAHRKFEVKIILKFFMVVILKKNRKQEF